MRGDPRVAALVAHFETVANGAMRDMPVVNRALRVEAIGFAPMPGDAGARGAWFGVLITPWSMNLLWLPGAMRDSVQCPLPAGKACLRVGNVDFEWIGAHAQDVGAYAYCSLFSPMFEFAGQESAAATARAVLAQLRGGEAGAKGDGKAVAPSASRRAFLLRPGAFGSAA
ncbi:[NiFe]-hydrogenase assembly chaperone HybE [Paraburkholderia mimosarum]|uniref:[NiFe]-hydrogenase assembly chaperone HybE n=1 Tax=Paraburkholderia mimosarum TaxID=312026 RepID=UPI00055B1DD0|nr:[NiFe]-hydrogenase assembly chaperone HybE [Paraburkholderia mimosarum]